MSSRTRAKRSTASRLDSGSSLGNCPSRPLTTSFIASMPRVMAAAIVEVEPEETFDRGRRRSSHRELSLTDDLIREPQPVVPTTSEENP